MTTVRITPPSRFDYEAATDPTISINPPCTPVTWWNSASGELFICIDNTIGYNVWQGQQGTYIYKAKYHLHYDAVLASDRALGTEVLTTEADGVLAGSLDVQLEGGTASITSGRIHATGGGTIWVNGVHMYSPTLPCESGIVHMIEEMYSAETGANNYTYMALFVDGVERAGFYMHPDVAGNSYINIGAVTKFARTIGVYYSYAYVFDAVTGAIRLFAKGGTEFTAWTEITSGTVAAMIGGAEYYVRWGQEVPGFSGRFNKMKLPKTLYPELLTTSDYASILDAI